MLAVALLAPPLLYVLGALLATGPRWRRVLGFVPAMAGLLAPYGLPAEWRLGRAFLTLFAIGAVLRATDLVLATPATPPVGARRRVAHALLVIDSYRIRRVPPAFDRRLALKCVAFFGVAAAGRALAFDVAPRVSGCAPTLAVRWLGGLLYVYGVTDVAYSFLTGTGRALGFAFPEIHRDPALSRSVREFWGRRWNRVVSGWLEARFYRPMARLGRPRLGVVLAFLFSAALHVYVAAPALGWKWGAVVGLYFLIQGAIAILEGPLRVARWPPAAGHVWLIAVMTVTSPLFCEPFLQVVAP